MRVQPLLSAAIVASVCLVSTVVFADNQWTDLGATDRWDDVGNWDQGFVPIDPTTLHIPASPNNFNGVAFNNLDNTNIIIDGATNAQAFAVQIGGPKGGAFGNQAASNTLTMTGGSLTTQGNFLFNVGRGTNVLPTQLVQFNMSGGVVNAAGITVPEAFSPGVGSVGINAEMHVSGSSVVTTDLLRLGSNDANSTVTVSDTAQIIISDDNNGFANGQLWLESFEDLDSTGGTSVLDIMDSASVRIDGGVNNVNIADDLAGVLDLINNELIPRGMIVANSGAGVVGVQTIGGSVFLTAQAIPEPTSAVLMLMSCSLMLARRQK